ncbi:MAG: helix-turn-helix transcriptional regulator [Eubacterium sp.]|nr:helix-turn-helix transcriptional regulator [Eubacterium sp.]
MSSRTISRWETGAYMPDISMLDDIAELYNVDIREIIEGERVL